MKFYGILEYSGILDNSGILDYSGIFWKILEYSGKKFFFLLINFNRNFHCKIHHLGINILFMVAISLRSIHSFMKITDIELPYEIFLNSFTKLGHLIRIPSQKDKIINS